MLPDCYAGSSIRVEVQTLGQLSCFIRHEDGRVTCPIGRELFKKKDMKYGTEYSSREACRTCPNRCTDSRREKHVNIGRNSKYVPVLMYGNPDRPLQPIPDVAQSTPLNNFGKLRRAEKRVMVFIRRDIPRQKLRQRTSEHPFGTIKHAGGGRCFLCKGKEKVTAEFALFALAYNLRRAIRLCGGVPKLIELYRRTATHLVLHLSGGRELRFSDTRRFGRFWLLRKGEADTYTGMEKLGAEPFESGFSGEYLSSQLGRRKKAIKECLLDQGVIAGIGNIYSDEILFAARIHPERLANTLTTEEWNRLASVIPERLAFFVEKNISIA